MKRFVKWYLIDAMGAMALGLFASLLIGTIIGTIAGFPYTVADDEKIIFLQPCFDIELSREIVELMLFE